MEYWEELSDKYSTSITGLSDEEITKEFKAHQAREKGITEKFGKSSWKIEEFAELLLAEKISRSKFRELVRYEMNENFNKL